MRINSIILRIIISTYIQNVKILIKLVLCVGNKKFFGLKQMQFSCLDVEIIFLHWFFVRLSVAIQFHAIVYLEPWTLHGYCGYKDASVVRARTKLTDDDGSKIKSRWGSCCTNRFFQFVSSYFEIIIICDSWSVEIVKVSCLTIFCHQSHDH